MKELIRLAVIIILMLCITGCRLSYKKIEGVWTLSEVNGAEAAQYAAVTGRTTEAVVDSYTVSADGITYENIDGVSVLKPQMTSKGFTVIIDSEEKEFFFNSEKETLTFFIGEEEWVYRREN